MENLVKGIEAIKRMKAYWIQHQESIDEYADNEDM
jgi:hypothetical protein